MSKARLVITAVTIEKRPVSEVARSYGVARSWIYALLARYQAEGEAASGPRSRRPKTSPSAISASAAGLIIALRKELAGQGLDAGPHTIAWHLQHHHQVAVSPATVSRYLTRAGLVTPAPAKRPRSSYLRFAAELPNECWQSDFTHYRLADGTDTEVLTEVLTWLDDHSRSALSVTAHRRVTGPIVLAAFRAAVTCHGVPACTLTDNGMVFTTRLSGGKDGRNHLEAELRRLGVRQKNGKPNHPQTQGKAGRFQRTLKKWLRSQRSPPPSASCRPCSTPSPAFTTPGGRTGPCRTGPPPPPPTPPGPKPPPATGQPTPTTGSRRPRRRRRQAHPARRRQAPPHRHRPDPRPDPRPDARLRPARPRHQRRHRRTAPRAHHRPRQELPAHRQATRTPARNTTPAPPTQKPRTH